MAFRPRRQKSLPAAGGAFQGSVGAGPRPASALAGPATRDTPVACLGGDGLAGRAAPAIRLTFALEPPVDRPGGLVVPLSPQALARCQEIGAEYVVVDDLVDRRQIVADVDNHLRWQLRWIAAFGEIAGAPEACRTVAQLLKTPLDSAVVWARVLRSAVAAVQPSGISYFGPGGDEEANPLHHGHLQYWPKLGDLPLAARLLPLIARDLSLPLETTPTRRPLAVDQEAMLGPLQRVDASRGHHAASHVKARLAPLRHLSMPRMRPGRRRGGTVFTWQGGYGLGGIARAERAEGARVLFLQRGGTGTAILALGPLGYGPVGRPLPYGPVPSLSRLPGTVTALLHEVDDRTGISGTGDVLRRRLEAVRSVVLPSVERLAAGLRFQLEATDVDRVVSTNAWSLEEFALLLAAGRSGVERVLYQHGDHAFSYDGWLLTETPNFERMVASDPSVPPDLKEGGRRLRLPTPRTSIGLHRATAPSATRAGEGPICYVPATLTGDTAVLPPMYFEDAWYLRWQLRLLAAMLERPAARFVWKALPQSNQADDPIPALLSGSGATNVRYETRPFREVLPEMGRVVLDFPSTALYEAVQAGVPTVCVSFARFAQLRHRATEMFDGVLHGCDDESSALTLVRRFLDTPLPAAGDATVQSRQRLLDRSAVI